MSHCKSIGNSWCTFFCSVAIVGAFSIGHVSAQRQETLPPAEQEETLPACPPNRPLTALTVDISPLNADGQPAETLPRGCLPESIEEPVPFMVTYGPECWNCRDLLQLARFCHPRLYFEDVRLERYGFSPVFPCMHSTGEFTSDLFFYPARKLANHQYPCVRTPTPHCWSGCAVCGF